MLYFLPDLRASCFCLAAANSRKGIILQVGVGRQLKNPHSSEYYCMSFTVAAKSNANALFSLQRHEQERSQPAQLSV
jgi:hypothetical protein